METHNKINDSELIKLKQDIENINGKISQNENIITIAFTTVEHKFILPVLCKKTDKFICLETKLCEKYPEYKDGEISFTIDGRKINRIETLSENGIKCSDVIIVHKNE